MSEPFACVVADPPWRFDDDLPGDKRGAATHYPCLTVAQICLFELPPIADDAWLFMWRVGSMQTEALAVVRAWGFRDPTSEIVWVKAVDKQMQIGMGRSVRNVHEVCLIAKRGKPERIDAGVPSVIVAPRGRHSAKPDRFYAAVERLVPGPRVELFSRRVREGWTCLGNEVPGPELVELDVAAQVKCGAPTCDTCGGPIRHVREAP